MKNKDLPKFNSIVEIFNTNLSFNEKVELSSEFAMFQVNQSIDDFLFKYRNRKPISVKYEDSDLYRLGQIANDKRELERRLRKYTVSEINELLDSYS